ncbi:hypothetical protein PSEUDO8AS_50077 [Pseudomonas sp. 8AS]|nr:hypothetical protein PSEUDO8AS_50077 [Pseudomonas sp. 8AS]
MQLDSIPELIAALGRGEMVVLGDDDNLAEGSLLMAAERVDDHAIAFMAVQARGLICLALTEERCRHLGLPPWSQRRAHRVSDSPSRSRPRAGSVPVFPPPTAHAPCRSRWIWPALPPTWCSRGISSLSRRSPAAYSTAPAPPRPPAT